MGLITRRYRIQGGGDGISVHFAVTFLDCWRTSFCVTTITEFGLKFLSWRYNLWCSSGVNIRPNFILSSHKWHSKRITIFTIFFVDDMTTKKTKVLRCESLKLFIQNKEIDRIGAGCKNESFKFVGIHLDENLSWNHHHKAIKKQSI